MTISSALSSSNSYNALSSALSGSSSSSGLGSSTSGSSGTSGSSTASNAQANNPSYTQAIQTQQKMVAYSQLEQLGNQFSNLMTGIEGSTLSNPLGATTSNAGVAYVSTSTDINYSVQVNRLAAAQSVTTTKPVTNAAGTTLDGTTNTSGTDLGMAGSLSFQLGNYDSTLTPPSFVPNGTATTLAVSSTDTLSSIANNINNLQMGITASVVSVTDGSGNTTGYKLQMLGGSTGFNNGFSVSVASETDASNTSSTSTPSSTAALQQFAYSSDPTVTAAQTNGMTQTVAPVDAAYSVNGTAYTSASNMNVPVAANINLNLITTGQVNVDIPQAPTDLLNDAQNLVNYYNSMLQGCQQYTSQIGEVTTPMQTDLTLSATDNYNTGGTNSSLSDLGITIQADGSLQIDSTTLEQAYSNDPTSTRLVLSESAMSMNNAVNTYTGGGGEIQSNLDTLDSQMTGYENSLSSTAAATAYMFSDALGALNNPDLGLTG